MNTGDIPPSDSGVSNLGAISLKIPTFWPEDADIWFSQTESHKIIITARVYFMKRVKDCKDVSIMSPKKKTDKFTLCIHCNFLLFLSTTVCSQNIDKQNVNIADENLMDYSFLSRYYTMLNQRIRYRIRH